MLHHATLFVLVVHIKLIIRRAYEHDVQARNFHFAVLLRCRNATENLMLFMACKKAAKFHSRRPLS